jgi:hypothetical protein
MCVYCCLLQVTTVAWAVTFHVSKVSSYVSLIFHAVVVEWLGFGVLVSTLCWWIANHYLRIRGRFVINYNWVAV